MGTSWDDVVGTGLRHSVSSSLTCVSSSNACTYTSFVSIYVHATLCIITCETINSHQSWFLLCFRQDDILLTLDLVKIRCQQPLAIVLALRELLASGSIGGSRLTFCRAFASVGRVDCIVMLLEDEALACRVVRRHRPLSEGHPTVGVLDRQPTTGSTRSR
jgi:hypothetical protein